MLWFTQPASVNESMPIPWCKLDYGVLSDVADYINLMLHINHIDNSSAWWQVNEYRKRNTFEPVGVRNKYTWNSTIRIVTFNERVAPSILATVTSYGSVDLFSLICWYARRVSCRSFQQCLLLTRTGEWLPDTVLVAYFSWLSLASIVD